MDEFLTTFQVIILPAFNQTLYMTILTMLISTVLALIIAIVLVYTDKYGLKPNQTIYNTLDVIINILRSVPFIILAVAIIPFTRSVIGTSVGETAAIVPLTVASAPFLARLFESSFKKVDPTLVEAAQSFGASNSQIIRKVIIRESVPSVIMDITVAFITVLGLTAMAGTIGAGGLGAVSLTYGYQSFNETVMFTTIILLVILTGIIQLVGNYSYNKTK